jgi:hypothetical protein
MNSGMSIPHAAIATRSKSHYAFDANSVRPDTSNIALPLVHKVPVLRGRLANEIGSTPRCRLICGVAFESIHSDRT